MEQVPVRFAVTITTTTNPPKKRRPPISENPNFDKIQLFQTIILHQPLKTVHSKNTIKQFFFEGGQVIDSTVARLLTLKRLKCGQAIDSTAHIYIYIAGTQAIAYIFGSKPIYHPRLARKKEPFLHQFARKIRTVLTLEI